MLSRGRKAKGAAPMDAQPGPATGSRPPAGRAGATEDTPNAPGIVSGVPDALCRPSAERDGPPRKAYISHATRGATQSGLLTRWAARPWRIDFDRGAVGARWLNPLMGWVSGGDAMQAVSVGGFERAEDAARFARAQGWLPVVQEDLSPDKADVQPKAYADNFTYAPHDPKIVRTK